MKYLLFAFISLISVGLFAQTGIGTTTPNASAKLEVYATNKGFLPPRVALLSTTDVATITTPATGLVVYNTNTAGSSPNAVVPSYYYWDGAKWNGLVDQGALQSFSGYVPNYAQSNASSVTKNAVGDIVVSQSITTSGRPIQIIATGDANPYTSGGWVQLQLYRDNIAIGKKIQAESSLNNENIPYCLNFIDTPTAGTYNYSVRIVGGGSGGFGFGESDGNHITLLELGAWSAGTMPVSKGGTGNSNYTNGSILFSDGTNITQNNSRLFWNNATNRLGIGTNAPASTLDVNGSAIFRTAGGDEGGEIEFGVPQTNTTLSTRVVADVWQNRFRIFDGNTKGVYVDLSKAPAGASGEISWKVSGLVTAGNFITIDNLKFSVTTSDPRGLSIATVSGTVNLYVEGRYNNGGAYGTRTTTPVAYNTSPSGSPFGWGFLAAGDTIIYHLTDADNSRMYRVTLMIMPSYINNFICIERLL
jgi:hypothetical protein